MQHNVILVGVIPGPKEHINYFLAPLVNELLSLWNGVLMTSEQGTKIVVRAALLCCGCDIPAARKCCGFVGCNALQGCSKCMVKFPTSAFGEKPDFSNLRLDSKDKGTMSGNRQEASQFKNRTGTKTFGKRVWNSLLSVVRFMLF